MTEFRTSVTDMVQHAKLNPTKESCGLVVLSGMNSIYIACPNVSTSPENEFVIDPRSIIEAERQGEILSVVHSHPDNCTPSAFDIEACNRGKVMWSIVNASTGEYNNIYPEKFVPQPYVGRKFVHGMVDCFTLLKDYYLRERGIVLGEYYRPEKWWEMPELNLYLDNAEDNGFYKVDEPRKGDVVLMNLRTMKHPNHVAIYLGDNKILHHVAGRLSKTDAYGGYWRTSTHSFWRHDG